VPAKGLPKLRSASLLDSGAPIEFRQSDQNLTLQLPAAAPDKDVTVIALRAA